MHASAELAKPAEWAKQMYQSCFTLPRGSMTLREVFLYHQHEKLLQSETLLKKKRRTAETRAAYALYVGIPVGVGIWYNLYKPHQHPQYGFAGIYQKNDLNCIAINTAFQASSLFANVLNQDFYPHNKKTLIGTNNFPILTEANIYSSLAAACFVGGFSKASGNHPWNVSIHMACKAGAASLIGNKITDTAKFLNKRFNLLEEDSAWHNIAEGIGSIAAHYYAAKLVNKISPYAGNPFPCDANGNPLDQQRANELIMKKIINVG